jgi:hypothetical protein
MSRYTPGPWTIAPRKNKYRAIPDDPEELQLVEKYGLDKFEALSIGTNSGQIAIVPLDESSLANATLISCTPLLLDVAKGTVSLLETIGKLIPGNPLPEILQIQIRDILKNLRALIGIAESTRWEN